MTCPTTRTIRQRCLSWFIVALACGALLPELVTATLAPNAPLPQPVDITCQGYEKDTVRVSWIDMASDESNYRVERKIGNGSFTEVATIAPKADGKYDPYSDTGADVSSQNRHYRVRAFRSGDSSYSDYSAVCNNRRIYESTHFRIFYGLLGTADECPQVSGQEVCLTNTSDGMGNNVFVTQLAGALEGSADAFTRVGFTRYAGTHDTLDKIPINVVWCDGGGCAGGGGLGISPFDLETPFNEATLAGDPVKWVGPVHETFHFEQGKYGGLNDPGWQWVTEGQARSIQDKICIGADRNNCVSLDGVEGGYAGYVPQVQSYLGNTKTPINQSSYSAALFWTYLTEKFGTSAPGDTIEAGMNFMVKFWEDSANNPGRDGISIIDSTLAGMGYSKSFKDAWKDFAVADYAKDLSGPGVQSKYKYVDMSQPGGNYGPVTLTLSRTLNIGDQAIGTGETVLPWSAHYYELRPGPGLPTFVITITQDSNVMLYYTVLAIKGSNVVDEYNVESRNLERTLVNDNFDRVVVIVAGLENLANYRYAFNGTQPSLRILSPTTANKARVGSSTAPEKFIAMVEVIDPAGVPLPGVDLNQFNFRVGTRDVPSDTILTSATVYGQQWFIMRAPTQTVDGKYDLQVRYSTLLTGTQSQAVNYTPRGDADNIILIDKSGSMNDFGKMDVAKTAARLYVDSWRNGDKIGVVSFADDASPDMALTNWTDSPNGGSRKSAFDTINGLSAGGNTSIGDGLRMSYNQLTMTGIITHDWAIVLLSDGLETAPEFLETVKPDFDPSKPANAGKKLPVIHTVAIGPDANRPDMQKLAALNNGTYQFVSEPTALAAASAAAISNFRLNLDSKYRYIAAKVVGQQQFFSLVGPLAVSPLRNEILIPVENGATELVISLSWDGIAPAIINLANPSNAAVSPFESDTRHRVWRVALPAGGTWKLTLNSTPSNPLPPYFVQASLFSQVTMDTFLPTPLSERTPGVPMPIIASLTENKPVTGALVLARVETPMNITKTIRLYDDGLHGDGAANDGLYGNVFHQTGAAGSYNVTVVATGTTPLSGPFRREDILSFHLESKGDCDGDGMPDEWEIRYGTDPCRRDTAEDPDHDGLTNFQEWLAGTDPHNPDTDGDGESDGTDRDPLDPSDGRIKPTWTLAHAGIGKVQVRYAPRPRQYVSVLIYRGLSISGTFTLLTEDRAGTGSFIDTQVQNGQTYCYQVMARGFSGEIAANLAATCATPKADPLPPQGYIVINNKASATLNPNVTLTLWALDIPDPHFADPLDAVFPPPDSASGVSEMMIGNRADLSDGRWEPYATGKAWRLDRTSGLAAVFVKYRDAAGNESEIYASTIYVGSGPGINRSFLPLVER